MPRQIPQQVLIFLTESLYHGIYPPEQRSNTTPVLPFLGRLSPCCGKELLSAVWHCPLQAPSHAPALELRCCHCVEARPRTDISCFTTRQAAAAAMLHQVRDGERLVGGLTCQEWGCPWGTQGIPALCPCVLPAVPGWSTGEIMVHLQTHEGVMNLMLSAGNLCHSNRV